MSKWAPRALAVLSVSAALLAGSAAPPSEAATSVSIAGVAKTDAADMKSKGIIRTPVVKTPGNTAVVSRSYVVTKGKKVVAKTASQSKAYKLGVGTYRVKSTVKYRNFTETDQYRKVTERQVVDYKERQVAHKDEAVTWEEVTLRVKDTDKCKVVNYSLQNSAWRVTYDCTSKDGDWYLGEFHLDPQRYSASNMRHQFYGGGYEFFVRSVGERDGYDLIELTTDDGNEEVAFQPKRWFQRTTEVVWYETVYDEVWGNVIWDEWVGTKKSYGATRTVTKTQTVKISNSGTMTLYEYKKIKSKAKLTKVKSTVGGTGKVVDRWSWGKDDYVIRVFNGHAIYFKNGKVDSKYWNWA